LRGFLRNPWTTSSGIGGQFGAEFASREPAMKRNAIKYVVDAALFVDICSIAALGLLLRFVIPRGRGPGFEKYFLWLQRRQWGDIHLSLSLGLLILLCVHVCFNWPWIVQWTKCYFGDHWKNFLWAASCAWIVVLFLGWMVERF
jgi:hypothetical protein